jgi:hypothetical protein
MLRGSGSGVPTAAGKKFKVADNENDDGSDARCEMRVRLLALASRFIFAGLRTSGATLVLAPLYPLLYR